MGIVSRSQGGGSGVGALLFSSVLGAPAASIDTGAGGIAGTQNILEVVMYLRTDDAAAAGLVNVTLNNDGGANYDYIFTKTVNVTVTGGQSLAQTAWVFECHGAGGGASYASTIRMTFPAYATTALFKAADTEISRVDSTAANVADLFYGCAYKSVAAISRLKVAAAGGAANLVAGSAVYIFGR